MKSINSLMFIVLVVLFSFSSLLAQEPKWYSSPEEVLGILEETFVKKEAADLDQICSYTCLNSEAYNFLKKHVDSNFIELSYRKESAEQVFFIKDSHEKLVVQLDRNKDRSWSVKDVLFNNNGNVIGKPKASFSPLSYADHFYDLAKAIRTKDANYLGFAPGGQLNLSQLDTIYPKLTSQTTITYKNIIIHNGQKPIDFIYITLKDVPCNNADRCGWLIEKIGWMKEFYEDDIFVQFLLQQPNNVELNKPSKLFRTLNLKPYLPPAPTLESLLDGAFIEKRQEKNVYLVKASNTFTVAKCLELAINKLKASDQFKTVGFYSERRY